VTHGAADLDRFRLFDGLAPAQRDKVWSMCERVEVGEGATLIEQGTVGEELYLIDEGEFAVIRRDADREYTVNRMTAGQDFGVIALFEQGVRTATLRATRPSVVYRLRFRDLAGAYGYHVDAPYAVMLRNELRTHTDLLRSGNEVAVAALRRELDEAKRRLSFGHFVAFLIGSVTAYAFLLRILLGTGLGKVDSTFITVGVLVACVLFCVPLIRASGFPPSTYGLTLRGWRPALRDSLRWTAIFLAVVTVLKLILLQVVPSWRGQPLFSMYGFTRYATLGEALGLMGMYVLFCPIQEFIARGVMQSSLQEFLSGPHAARAAILLSTLMFTQIHLHLAPGYAVAAFFPSLFWGALYARHRTLLGVSVSHVLIGVYVAFFLGLPLMVH